MHLLKQIACTFWHIHSIEILIGFPVENIDWKWSENNIIFVEILSQKILQIELKWLFISRTIINT